MPNLGQNKINNNYPPITCPKVQKMTKARKQTLALNVLFLEVKSFFVLQVPDASLSFTDPLFEVLCKYVLCIFYSDVP